jgi:hypothetical protein
MEPIRIDIIGCLLHFVRIKMGVNFQKNLGKNRTLSKKLVSHFKNLAEN